MNTTINELQRGRLQTLTGVVERITDEDEFILNDGTGRIQIDANLDDRWLPIAVNQTLTVVGRLDGNDFDDFDDFDDNDFDNGLEDDFDAFKISRVNGTVILDRMPSDAIDPPSGPNSPSDGTPITPGRRSPLRTFSGRIERITDEDEFILRSGSRRIRVDANLPNDRRLPLSSGQRVTVLGRFDDDFELQAQRISRANGRVIFNRQNAQAFSTGEDILVGSPRHDRLNGGNGNDMLVGQGGRDLLTGGTGQDRFVYESIRDRGDRITDFSTAEDVIDLRSLLDRSLYSSPQPFVDYVQLVALGSSTVVRIDPDGDRSNRGAQALVTLDNVAATALSASNFLV